MIATIKTLTAITVLALAALATLLGMLGDTAEADSGMDTLIYQQDATQHIQTRMLVSYTASCMMADGTDNQGHYCLDTWNYIVSPAGLSPEGTITGYICYRRDAATQLPSAQYIREYQEAGGVVFEDGSCSTDIVAALPQ